MKSIPKIFLGIEKSREYGRGLLRGISKYARIHGPWMLLTKYDFYHSGSHFTKLKKGSIEGAIIREAPAREMKRILDWDIPIVVSCHISTNLIWPQILTDCEMIGRMGATHFLNSGFRRFAFCAAGESFWSERRSKSFVQTVAEAGFEAHVYQFPAAKKNQLHGNEQRRLAQWIATLPKPIAIMACTDDRAMDLIEACEISGVRIPEDVAVLGVDNDQLVCDMTSVTISSIALNVEQAGYEAAELLDQRIKGKASERRQIVVRPTHIQQRRSTDILAIEDPAVAKAVRFIHTHANRPLQVSEVARYVGLSERNLFNRFQQALGKSAYAEISRVRIAKITWMLETTHLSIKEISNIMGMPDEKHLSRYFQGEKKMSPGAWRKQQGTSSCDALVAVG